MTTDAAPVAPLPTRADAVGRAFLPAGSGVTVEAVSRAAALLVDLVPGCDHAAIILTPRRGVELVGVSGPTAGRAADVVRELGTGPSPLHEARTIIKTDLRLDEAWPAARAALHDAGMGGTIAQRIVADERRLGVLALFSEEPGALDADTSHIETYATILAGWLLAEEAHGRVDQLERALDSARTVGRAMGVLMAERRLLSAEASSHLKTMSNDVNVKVRDLASSVLEAHERGVRARRGGDHVAERPGLGAPQG